MSDDILARILDDTRARLARGEYRAFESVGPPGDGSSFVASLREDGKRIVAEFKARSPSAGEILAGADGRLETFGLHYRRGHAAAISVVVEEDHFGGRPDWIPRARSISGLPILMKDFVISEDPLDFARSLGADAVLLIVRALSGGELASLREAARARGLAAVVEAHGAEEIARAAAVQPDVLGVNARDLATFRTDLSSLAAAARLIPAGPVKLAESGIRSPEEVARLTEAGFDAFLVGEALLRSENPEDALRELTA
jgi:indole-3-glycerol phosphate synthase